MKINKELTKDDIIEVYQLAAEQRIPPIICAECLKPFYTFFAEHNERYERFINGEGMTCLDHTPTDLILENLSNPQN